MAASPKTVEGGVPTQDKWASMDDQGRDAMGPGGDADLSNGGPANNADVEMRAAQEPENADYPSSTGADDGKKSGTVYREKQIKPNKVYVGGLPEHTRQEDLQNCFGKIGTIIGIELKIGYGFVEFESREAAEESVAKYNEGYFMGNKIKVEISHGGSRTAKYTSDPGACFKCGQMGHWARECPNHVVHVGNGPHRRSSHHNDPHLIDRIQPPRDYLPPPPRDYPGYRDDYGPGRYLPPRDSRYGYDYPPGPPPPRGEFRKPVTPPREYREYPAGPPPRSARDYDDYRMRGPPPPPPPPSRYETRPSYYPPEAEGPPSSYPPPRGYPAAPPPRDSYDRYEKRGGPPERYPPGARPRTPPGAPVPPRAREEYERPPQQSRDYPPPPEYRGRPVTPPPPARYADYPPRTGGSEPSGTRYRRRSLSPPPRSAGGGSYDPVGYGGPGNAPYGGPPSGYASNGYSGGPGGPTPSSGTARSGGGARDYPSRNGRDAGEPGGSYRRP